MTWGEFAQLNPALAAFGTARLNGKVSYLATTQKDGAPRVHPVTPIVGAGHLFLFMEPTSPKGKDLIRDGRFALHCAVTDNSGESGEFWCAGRGQLIEDAAMRALAVSVSTYPPADRYILFELNIERAQSTVYGDTAPVRTLWKKDAT